MNQAHRTLPPPRAALAVRRFFETRSEEEGLALAERLRTPFVVTAEEGGETVAAWAVAVPERAVVRGERVGIGLAR